MISFSIRMLLTSFILHKVYLETGPWTLIFAIIVTIGVEVLSWANKKQSEYIEKLTTILETMSHGNGKLVNAVDLIATTLAGNPDHG